MSQVTNPLSLPLPAISAIIALNELGWSSRRIAEALGTNKTTVCRYLNDTPRPLCGCGKSVAHGGWCGVRIQASPRRQALHESMRALSPLSPEREQLFISHWPIRTRSADLLEMINALPGERIDMQQLRYRARQLNLKRLPGMQGVRVLKQHSASIHPITGRARAQDKAPSVSVDRRKRKTYFAYVSDEPIHAEDKVPISVMPHRKGQGYSMFNTMERDPRIAIMVKQKQDAGLGRLSG